MNKHAVTTGHRSSQQCARATHEHDGGPPVRGHPRARSKGWGEHQRLAPTSDHQPAWPQRGEDSGAALIAEFVPLLRRFFDARLSQDADELVQRTMLSLLRDLDGVMKANCPRSYIFRCAKNRVTDHLRTKRRRTFDTLPASLLADDRTTPTEHLRRSEIVAAVADCMSTLSDQLRPPLELHYWEGLRLQEIADILQIPVGTAKSRMRLARAKFARTFELRYGQLRDQL